MLINTFIAFATANLDLAIMCLDSFVTSGIACNSFSLFACSLSSRRILLSCYAEAGGKQMVMLDTMGMIRSNTR